MDLLKCVLWLVTGHLSCNVVCGLVTGHLSCNVVCG